MIRMQFIELWHGGVPLYQIAHTCQISKSTAQRLAFRLGLPARKIGRKPIDRSPLLPELERRWRSGERVVDIARALRIENGLVPRLAAQLGLPPRRHGGRRIGVLQTG